METVNAVNPLLLTPVVYNLSKYLAFDDLKNARLVCRQWYHQLTGKFASRSKFLLSNNDERRNKLNKFIEILESSEIFFISSVGLYLENINDTVQQLLTLCQNQQRVTELQIVERYEDITITLLQFQNIIQSGAYLTKLVICLPEFTGPLDTGFVSVSLSNLHSIEFICYTTQVVNNENYEFQFFSQFFSSATGLTEVIINAPRNGSPKSALQALKHAKNFKQISQLELTGSIDSESFEVLLQLSDECMNLTSLKLFMWVEKDDDRICWKKLESLLQTQIRSLKELKLTGFRSFDHIFQINNLSGVEKVRMISQYEVALCRFVGGIDPIRFARRRRGITIETNPEVKVTVPYNGVDFIELQELKRAFPKVSTLSIVSLTNNLSDIWGMSGLHHLHLICCFPGTCEAFLGFSEKTMKKIIRKKLYKVPTKWDKLERSGPSVTDLRELKYLRVSIEEDSNFKALVFMGLAQMTWLETLILGFTDSRKFESHLLKSLPNTKLSFTIPETKYNNSIK